MIRESLPYLALMDQLVCCVAVFLLMLYASYHFATLHSYKHPVAD